MKFLEALLLTIGIIGSIATTLAIGLVLLFLGSTLGGVMAAVAAIGFIYILCYDFVAGDDEE